MKVLPGWEEKIRKAPRRRPRRRVRVPLSAAKLSMQLQIIDSVDDAARMVQLVYETPVSCIGMDTEFRFVSPCPIRLSGKKEWRDIRSIQPFCLAFVVCADKADVRYAVDLRRHDLLESVQQVLDLPVPFVCHYAPVELFVLWKLALREPRLVWDTHIAERALTLGLDRPRNQREDDAEAARQDEVTKEEREFRLNLDSVADRYGIDVHRGHAKHRTQTSFLTKPFDEPLTDQELSYCADDAEIAAKIREPQRLMCDRSGICEIVDRVIMPWTVTAAEVRWTGVEFDRSKCQRFREASEDIQAKIAIELSQYGIANPGSSVQISDFLNRAKLSGNFPNTETGQVCTSDRYLKAREHVHPAIRLIRQYRKVRVLANDPAVAGLIQGADGRVHADFVVLGADSGRTQSRTPNLMGIGRPFRPLIRAADGYGIGDVDLSQIEIGIAAAVFRDEQMISDFNTGDVYVAQAKRILTGEIPPEDLKLSDVEFKRKHKNLRDRCKPLALGIIYGKTPFGIAADLRISQSEARRLWDAFSDQYRKLCDGMVDAREQSICRGYAYISGLRRFHNRRGTANSHEKRGLGNSYVQGTAALVFFDAGNRLRRLYRQLGARLIVPVHDAFVFEAPLGCLQEAADLTRRVMVETVQEWYPELRPRADVNTEHSECWNYGGHADSVDQFIADPTLRL